MLAREDCSSCAALPIAFAKSHNSSGGRGLDFTGGHTNSASGHALVSHPNEGDPRHTDHDFANTLRHALVSVANEQREVGRHITFINTAPVG